MSSTWRATVSNVFHDVKLAETSFGGRRDHHAAIALPRMQWVIAEIALGIAVSGFAKWA